MDAKKSEAEIIESLLGEDLETPLKVVIRVFHKSDPKYSYQFGHFEDDGTVLLVDDENGEEGAEENFVSFPANELVNVRLFEDAILDSYNTPLPEFPDIGDSVETE